MRRAIMVAAGQHHALAILGIASPPFSRPAAKGGGARRPWMIQTKGQPSKTRRQPSKTRRPCPLCAACARQRRKKWWSLAT